MPQSYADIGMRHRWKKQAGLAPSARRRSSTCRLSAGVAANHDVVVSAIGPSRTEDDGTRFTDSLAHLANTLGHRRLLVVGGTGSLTVNGVR